MKLPVDKLYELEHSIGPAFKRVRNAIDWLLSPAAKNEGINLLKDAYALHKKPLKIIVSEFETNNYKNLAGEHTVSINPRHVDMMKIGESLTPASLERIIAHEWGHATDPSALTLAAQIAELEFESAATKTANLTKQQEKIVFEPLEKAARAPSLESAAEHIKAYIKNFSALTPPTNWKNHKTYISLLNKAERKSMEAENRIAWLRKEPLRYNYVEGYIFSPQDEEQMTVDALINAFDLHLKPRIADLEKHGKIAALWKPEPASEGFWQRFVEKPKHPTTIKAEHPLIATHQSGGKT